MGGATPAIYCLTVWGQWAVELLSCTATLPGGSGVVSCRVVLCCVVLCRVVSCRAASCGVLLCCIVSCRVVLCRVLCCAVPSCRVVSRRRVSCRVTSRDIVCVVPKVSVPRSQAYPSPAAVARPDEDPRVTRAPEPQHPQLPPDPAPLAPPRARLHPKPLLPPSAGPPGPAV